MHYNINYNNRCGGLQSNVRIFSVGKLKVQLGLHETKIKSLLVNDTKYVGKLLEEPKAALLQVGIDIKGIPVVVIVSPQMRITSDGIKFKTGVAFNFFVGDWAANIGRDILERHLYKNTPTEDALYLREILPGVISYYNPIGFNASNPHKDLKRYATKIINIEGYGFKDKLY